MVPLDNRRWDKLLDRVDALSRELKNRTKDSLIVAKAGTMILAREIDKMISPSKK